MTNRVLRSTGTLAMLQVGFTVGGVLVTRALVTLLFGPGLPFRLPWCTEIGLRYWGMFIVGTSVWAIYALVAERRCQTTILAIYLPLALGVVGTVGLFCFYLAAALGAAGR